MFDSHTYSQRYTVSPAGWTEIHVRIYICMYDSQPYPEPAKSNPNSRLINYISIYNMAIEQAFAIAVTTPNKQAKGNRWHNYKLLQYN